VFAVVEDRCTPASVSKYLAGAFVWEMRDLNPDQFLEGMAIIGGRLNRQTIIIPTSDVAAILIAEHAEELQPWFLFSEQPSTLPRTLANKRELYQLCEKLGIAAPRTSYPTSMEDVREFVESATFPVLVKAAESWLLPEGARTTSLVSTPEQVYELFRDSPWPESNLILQEFIDPANGEDWFFHTYRSPGCQLDFTGRKFRSFPAFAGPTTLGKAIENPALRRQAEEILDAISYCGIADLDLRFDKRDGQFKLLDFNPRIGAQFRLFEDRTGVDVARALYLDLTGSPPQNFRETNERTFIAEIHDFAASVNYMRHGKLTIRGWLQSIAGKRELAWFSFRDLLPFLMMAVRLLTRQGRRALGWSKRRSLAKRLPRLVRGRSSVPLRRARNSTARAEA
jgi:D-aspartate ligase